ncbi:MAG: hypothetical protein HZA54_01320, partial [Planctomycetes bacterium]|nr:hypothetical protein [Planctomycetota bacterium]
MKAKIRDRYAAITRQLDTENLQADAVVPTMVHWKTGMFSYPTQRLRAYAPQGIDLELDPENLNVLAVFRYSALERAQDLDAKTGARTPTLSAEEATRRAREA